MCVCVCVHACVCVHTCVCVAKPVAVELRCHATALIADAKSRFSHGTASIYFVYLLKSYCVFTG